MRSRCMNRLFISGLLVVLPALVHTGVAAGSMVLLDPADTNGRVQDEYPDKVAQLKDEVGGPRAAPDSPPVRQETTDSTGSSASAVDAARSKRNAEGTSASGASTRSAASMKSEKKRDATQ